MDRRFLLRRDDFAYRIHVSESLDHPNIVALDGWDVALGARDLSASGIVNL
jgi:hypothetical protein